MRGSRAKALGLLVIVLLLAALAFRNGALAWMCLPLMSYLGLGLLLAPVREDLRLRASRRCEESRGAGSSSIEVILRLENEGRRRIRLLVIEPRLPGMKVAEDALFLRVDLEAGAGTELRYTFEARRGRFRWESLRALAGDPFGLFEVETLVEAGCEILVQPHYRRMPSIPLRLAKTLSSPGSIPIRLGGSGTDFWGIREYRQGDPLRRLYWRLNARDPLRRYTKEFIQERTAEIILILDGRERMELAVGDESIFGREVEAVASLAAMLIRQGQRVGLFIIGTVGRSVMPDYGRIQLRRILNCLAEVQPEREGSRNALHYLPALRYSRSTFMIIVSPFAKDDDSVFQRLRALGYQGILVSPDALDFARGSTAGDASTALARKACRIERKIELDRIAELSFPVLDWRVGEDLSGLIEARLRLAGRAAAGRGS